MNRTLIWGAAAAVASWSLGRLFLARKAKSSTGGPSFSSIPVIDMGPFVGYSGGLLNEAQEQVATAIGVACRQVGFFYIKNHGISEEVTARLERLAREFYALPLEEKNKSDMKQSGKAVRGYFNVGFEQTGGLPDQKEGFYFSRHITDSNHPLFNEEAHGPNIYPANPPELKEAVDSYMANVQRVAESLLAAVCVSLRLPPNYFHEKYTNDPFVFFALLFYPNQDALRGEAQRGKWGVGPHTDYGVLTILKQDMSGGLEVRNGNNEWVKAPPVEGTFVVNIGDMLEKMTGGLYRSTLHRVVSPPSEKAPNGRISFPFFFDPNFTAKINPIELAAEDAAMLEQFKQQRANDERWDRIDLISLDGTYGDYVKQKAFQIFPENFDKEKQKKMMR